MTTNQAAHRWQGASTAQHSIKSFQDRTQIDAFLRSQADLLNVGSIRHHPRRQHGMVRIASGIKSNGVAFVSAIATAGTIVHGVSTMPLGRPIAIPIGDNGTALREIRLLYAPSDAPVDDAWQGVLRSIAYWSQLLPDWDGDRAVTPDSFALDSAKHFLRLAKEKGARPPKPFIASDGEIGFRWRKEKATASVSFLSDGHIVVFCMGPEALEPIKIDQRYREDADFSKLFETLATFT